MNHPHYNHHHYHHHHAHPPPPVYNSNPNDGSYFEPVPQEMQRVAREPIDHNNHNMGMQRATRDHVDNSTQNMSMQRATQVDRSNHNMGMKHATRDQFDRSNHNMGMQRPTQVDRSTHNMGMQHATRDQVDRSNHNMGMQRATRDQVDLHTTTSNSYLESVPRGIQPATREQVDHMFRLCRKGDWKRVLCCVQQNPGLAITPMVMDNHINTTIVHQAITSKGTTEDRASVISQILSVTPQAASIKNGYGSLPLHVISQRNTKIKSSIKERLIIELVHAYKGALVEEGGVGKRTPLHIIFTDYVSSKLTKLMIDNGREACFIKDKKGFLPAHVACSRHCSPEKLRMLLAVNPQALYEKTSAGDTLLMLAQKKSTKSHPNFALIEELHRQLNVVTEDEHSDSNRDRLDSNESVWNTTNATYHPPNNSTYHPPNNSTYTHATTYSPPKTSSPRYLDEPMPFVSPNNKRKRKTSDDVDLLMHFATMGNNVTPSNVTQI